MRAVVVSSTLLLGAAACATTGSTTTPHPLRLDRVVLYRNGIGHFERRGALPDRHLRLVLRPHEIDDVIKTLTVIDRAGHAQQMAAVLPTPDSTQHERVVVDLVLSRPVRDLVVSYAVPTATWKSTYRIALPARPGAPLLLQAWALISNRSEASWDDVSLSLATGAPLSYATDLRTPHLVARPDATGRLVAPTATAIVAADRTRADDRLDRDGDRIPDRDDRCPDEPEAWNGDHDGDGCPERGRVVLANAELRVLDRIYFGPGHTEVPAPAQPVLDAIAATLLGDPAIPSVVIGGHSASDERDPWGQSARRAAAIRAALADRGVTQQLDVRNRRVELELGRVDDTEPTEAPITRETLAADTLLFRPDGGTPGSELHPYRAARVALPVELGLEPGPVAVFAEGSFAGEGLLQRTPAAR